MYIAKQSRVGSVFSRTRYSLIEVWILFTVFHVFFIKLVLCYEAKCSQVYHIVVDIVLVYSPGGSSSSTMVYARTYARIL